MSSTRTSGVEVYIVVEGQTEQTFIRDVLAPYMASKAIYLFPALIGKPGHKGGNIRFSRAKNDIGKFLKQRSHTYISTMFDFFRIDEHWPGLTDIQNKKLSAVHKAEILEAATRSAIIDDFSGYNASRRFIPYIEMHEFEAMLFSDAEILAEKTGIKAGAIISILNEYNNIPEEINEEPGKAPSERLKGLAEGYRKVAIGKIVTEAIGIPVIRKKCLHFGRWLTALEELKSK